MTVEIFEGDLTDAPADAICTSTNPRLSLMMGSGGAVRERGGFEVLRECEAITGGKLVPPGSVHVTTAGALPYKAAIHCVASNQTHMTSIAIIKACVRNAIARAASAGWTTIAMPVFGSGHARFKFDDALVAMLDAIEETRLPIRIVIAINDPARAESARRVLLSARSSR
ncbi:MAG TPA: macro domain-containing protein [Thermoanaerobaculia bacterium]|nr:macro domain-containing protein [Thermoanaerobaculia bacterium]